MESECVMNRWAEAAFRSTMPPPPMEATCAVAGVCVCAHLASSSSAFPEQVPRGFPRSSLLYFCFCATTTIKIVGPAPPSFPVTDDGQGAGRYRKTERPIAAGDTPTGMLIGVSCARTHSRRWCPWPRLSSSLRARRSPPCSWRPGRRPPARPRCRTS